MCRFSAEKMYTYIRGYATGANMHETLKALAFARKQHEGQLRKSGEPYIIHPLTMACLIDRCHNVSSMAGTFSKEKLKSYIDETRQYVFPLLRKAKTTYPEDSDILFVLKYHITSVVDSVEATMQVYEAEQYGREVKEK